MTDEAVIRARTHNLVVVVADEVSAEQTTHRVIERTGERPGRVIVVDIDHNHRSGLDARVTTYCRAVNRHQICGEMITLTTSPEQSDEAHSTVISLLAPDLPVYLWWSGVPDMGDLLFKHLAPEADRILVDSDTFSSGAEGLAAVAALQDEYRIGDMAWARLTPWRQLLARLWDSPELGADLAAFHSLDIHVKSAGPDHPGRAALLLGWLAARLGWSPSGKAAHDQGYRMQWSHSGGTGESRLVDVSHKDLSLGDIRNLELIAGEGINAVTVRLEMHPETSRVDTTLERGGKQIMKNACQIRQVDEAMALAEELDLGYDPSYAVAVKAAAQLLHTR
jgi:glucose-6-phosphate dehydrogenase assembly protein OpcA